MNVLSIKRPHKITSIFNHDSVLPLYRFTHKDFLHYPHFDLIALNLKR